ncbi:amidohydrolase family protein [Jiulongibacter sediminis]|uniref:Amidohydrolase n=1 Tax=Jiulongibacter sediminis TaxID=1605367 RepID=A0A0P7C7F5_9BACT|nr:amidohydrolase family protein [Jiulongibacter sediminis]KPM49461.1 amidohydrolase [Jiulongibacter sediminis]TBX26509.1 amidohydrolase [Jiulongibacter sediminis]
MKNSLKFLAFVLLTASTTYAQQIAIGDNNGEVTFEEYNPTSTLVVPNTGEIHRAKYPFIDVHNHQFGMNTKEKVDEIVTYMDSLNMGVMVNLSGRGWTRDIDESTRTLESYISAVAENQPGRIVIFTNIDFNNISEPGWTEQAVKMLEDDVKLRGAKGLKIYKSLGFSVQNADGSLVAVDDERIDPVWEKAGELGIPVLIHTADPAPFWDPMTKFNERWLELKTHPRRKRDVENGDYSWEELIDQQHNVFRKHPKTTFIAAHMGWYPNNLPKLDSLMTAMPNVYAEIGAVIAELGRQPRTANKFFTKWQDRVLFGKDSWKPEEYVTYFRVLETEDEYFQYHKKYHAFWPMYGLGLSDEVLKKMYYKNALKIIPGIDRGFFPE